MVSLAGESQNFDGNGTTCASRPAAAVRGPDARPSGAHRPAARERQPAAARHAPREDAEAALQAEREVPHAAGAGPERRADRRRPVMRQIKKQAPVFVAILFLLVIAVGIGGYILSNQRFYLPGWVPVLGHRLLHGRRPSCRPPRPWCPGQGQTVNIAGRQDRRGRLGAARGRQGRRRAADQGRVQADLPGLHGPAAAEDRPQGHVPRARPRHQAGRASSPEGGRVRVANTLPDVNSDEFLAQLDARHARLPPDPAERGRHRVRRRGHGRRRALRPDRRAGPARDLQALRADGARRQEDHAAARRSAARTSGA